MGKAIKQWLWNKPYLLLRAKCDDLELMVHLVVMMLVTTQKKMRINYVTDTARNPNCKK